MLDEMIESEDTVNAVDQKFNIKVDKKSFVKCLSHVQNVVERRNIIPILSNVLLSVSNNKLTLTATDMDIVFSETIDVECIESGVVTVSAHLLYEIVRKLDDESEIELSSIASNILAIKSSHSDFKLNTLPSKDFPKIEDGGYTSNFELGCSDLTEAIDRVKFSISNEETRYNLNGVFVHSDAQDKLKLVSTDGHRLSIQEMDSKGVNEFSGVIIPKKAIQEIRKIIDESGNAVNISLSENKIKFASESFVMISKLIDAKYPSYQSLIPSDNNLEITVNREGLVKSIDRVSTINNEKFRGIKLDFNKDVLTLSSSGDSGGMAKEVVKLANDCGEQFDIGFNARYLLEILSILDSSSIVCAFKDSFSPVVVYCPDVKGYKHILMPMRV